MENSIKLKDSQIRDLTGEKGELSEVTSLQLALKLVYGILIISVIRKKSANLPLILHCNHIYSVILTR